MGILKDGTISGVIPEQRLFAVHYPGYPTSVEKAIQTLGGEDGISKVRSSESNFLELRFRPDDPYSHPVFGELHATPCLLLRICRTSENNEEISKSSGATLGNDTSTSAVTDALDAKNKSPEIEVGTPTNGLEMASGGLEADIVARVEYGYEFNGMADYQYVPPVHAELSKGKKRRHIEQRFERGGLMDVEQEEMMILVPPLFSLKDMPEEIVLRPSEVSRASQRQRALAELSWEMDIIPCFNLDFKIREIPRKVNWEEKLAKGSADWHLQTAVSMLFEERPIWAKATLNDRLVEQGVELTDFQLRRLLFRTAYYFAYGPFRTLWIRNGYDPRKDPESRIHQMIDFRVPKPLRNSAQADVRAKVTWKDICSFKDAPLKKFSYLQFYDLQDDYIQSQVRRPPERSTCSEFTGWFRRSTLERLRRHVRVRFLALIPGDMARALEQVELKTLQKLKRMDETSSLERNQLEFTSETGRNVGYGDIEPLSSSSTMIRANTRVDEDEDKDLENEEEEEEEEEEYEDDEFQELQEGGFTNSTEKTSMYMEPSESIPKNYLQQLLGKFPFHTADDVRTIMGSQARDIDLSDEDAEYAIFDQEDEDDDL